MRKIYISADVEGLNGVVNPSQIACDYSIPYNEMCLQLHKELNALIKGLKLAGVEDIVINDAHGAMNNIALSELPEDVTLITGKPKPVSMMYGLHESFDAVIFLGCHAKVCSNGVLAHTFNMAFKDVKLNGATVGEAQLNAIFAASKGVGIVLASGDDVLCSQIKEDIGNITTIETKKAISFSAAVCRKNEELLEEYIQTASKVNNLPIITYPVSDNYIIEIELADGKCEKFSSSDYEEVYKFMQKISATV
ncbi:MAG: M55 family metallopeptidase [Candidatus Gastranaerophilales bacterium]|nr:M55 family metallopeptidase [Candidatus Gastranaerophilales bacterium]